MVYNKIYAQIGEERHIVLDPINYQYDIKQILVIQGETVPDYYEADVCNTGDTATLTMVGTAADGVEIPDKFLLDGRNVLVYVVIPGSGGDVQTRYDITIPVDERAEREDIDPSEAEQQQIDSLVAALNSGVGRAETAATEAEGSASNAAGHATDAEAWAAGQRAGKDVGTEDPTYHNNAKYYAGMAEAAAEEAGQHEASWETWVQRAETAAGNAEGSATAAGQSKTDAEAAAQTATQKAAAADASATEAENSASEAAQTVDGGVGAINTARDGALTAIGQAGTTQVNAVNQAGAAQVTAVNQAGTTQVQAVEDKGKEVLDLIPQDYSDLVDDVADLTRQLSDLENAIDQKQNAPSSAGTAGQVLGLDSNLDPVWVNQSGGGGDVSNCAPIIINTASGDVASFADGADNRQIRKIVGTIVLVQSGTGDPSPDNVRPISGWTGANITGTGVNILDIRYGKALPYTANGITFTEVANGGIQISGTATSNAFWNASFNGSVGQPCDKFRGQHIYFSYGNAIQGVDAKTGYINTAGALTTFNNGNVLGNDAKYFRFYIQIASGSNFTTPVTIYPQIEIGTARTVFEPFGTTLPINWQSSAGTIYGGTVTLNEDGSADVVSDVVTATITGSTTVRSVATTAKGFVIRYTAPNGCIVEDVNRAVRCNVFQHVDLSLSQNLDANTCTVYNPLVPIFVFAIPLDATSDYTKEGAQAYVASLSTPIVYTYKTTNAQNYHLDNIGQLKTFLGTNKVWIDTGAITECNYPADTKLYIDGKIAEMQATILENIGG